MAHSGMNLRTALHEAANLGCHIRATAGELIITHPKYQLHPVRINGRRKDAPRALTGMIKKVKKLLSSSMSERRC